MATFNIPKLDITDSDIDLGTDFDELGTGDVTAIDPSKIAVTTKSDFPALQQMGNLLRSAVSVLSGRRLPSDKLRQERALQRQAAIKMAQTELDMIQQVFTMTEGRSQEEATRIRNHFAKEWENVLPNASVALSSTDVSPEEGQAFTRFARGNEVIEGLIATGNIGIALDLFQDEDAREALEAAQDIDNFGPIKAQTNEFMAQVTTNMRNIKDLPISADGAVEMTFAQFASINFNMSQAEQDPQNPALSFSRGQMSTIDRNPESILPWIRITDRQETQGLEVGEANFALKLIGAGIPFEQIAGSLREETRETLKDVTIEQANAALASGRGITDITTPEGFRIRIGVPAGEAAARDAEIKALEDQNIAVLNVNNEIGVLLGNLDEDPTVATSARGLARLAGSAAANVDELIKTFGLDLSDMTIKGPISVEDVRSGKVREGLSKILPDILIQKSAAHQAAAFNLAYLVLASRGVSGKAISDAELKQTIQALGTGLDDPVAQIAALKDVRRQVTSRFNTVLDVKGKRLGDLSKFRVETKQGGKFANLSDEDFNAQLQNAGNLSPEDRKELLREGKRRRK